MISEGSCDTEDLSNAAENSALHHKYFVILFKIYPFTKQLFSIVVIFYNACNNMPLSLMSDHICMCVSIGLDWSEGSTDDEDSEEFVPLLPQAWRLQERSSHQR